VRIRRAPWIASLALVSCATSPDVPPAATTTSEPPVAVAPEPPTIERPFDDRLPAPETATEHVPVPWPFDVTHYDISIVLLPRTHEIQGDVTIEVKDDDDGLAELPLDAVDLAIAKVRESVENGPAFHDVAFAYDGKKLRVPLDEPRRAGTARTIYVEYSGRPQRGIYFNDGPYGEVFTQGEAEDSRYWFPCHDEPDDRATHHIVVNAPETWTTIAAGTPDVGNTLKPGYAGRYPKGRAAFSMTTPHVAYLTTLVSGAYREIREDGVVPLSYFVEERDAGYAKFDFRKTNEILKFFGDYTGLPYPYPKYAQTCVHHFMFGGMENISATTLTDHAIHPQEWEPAHESTSLIAHEAAHQWFGDWITCKDWSHCWLNEGFATYFDLLFTEHDEGRDAFLWRLRGERRGALDAMDHKRRAVVSNKYVEPMDLFDGHAYPGGACRLHMLRHLLGDKTFQGAIRHYVEKCALQCVTTDDFQHAVEEYSGQDLGWFFDQWFRKPGYPVLKIRWKWDDAKKAEIVTVEQTQKGDGTPDAYRLPLEIEFSRIWRTNDADTQVRRVDVTKRSETFEFPLPFQPRRVQPDPETALLARFDLDRSVGEQADALFGAGNPSWRFDGAEGVAAFVRDPKNTPDYTDSPYATLLTNFSCYVQNFAPFDPRTASFRAALAPLVACRKNDVAADALAEATRSDPDLRVRLAAADALHGFNGNQKAIDALTALLHDPNDLLRASAVTGLAKLKAPNAFETLTAQLDRPGWRSVVRNAALRGFADLGDERAFATLVQYARPENDWATDSAHDAIDSLGRMGKKRPEYRDALLPYLDDTDRTIRHAAAEALAKIADPDTIPTLVAHFRAETWPACRDALRHAVKACRATAVEDGRLVSVESVRASELRERHAALRDEAAALEKALKDLAANAKTDAEARLKSLKDQMAQLQRDLAELGVPVKPVPKPPAPPKA